MLRLNVANGARCANKQEHARQAFSDFDGCFAVGCDCGATICGYCLDTGSSSEIHSHIGRNQCWIRRHMHPAAGYDTFHLGASKDQEFQTARRLRIGAELLQLFDELPPLTKSQLAHRIRRDVADNGLDTSLFYVEDLDAQL